jgi:Acetyltransferase (GNAT) domain
MVIVEGRKLLWRDRLVFFANGDQLEELVDGTVANEILRIRQTGASVPAGAGVLERKRFRTSCLDLARDLDELYGAMDGGCRYRIQRGRRLGERVTVRRNDDRAATDFMMLYERFTQRNGHAHPLSAPRYREYSPVADTWTAYFDGRAMCAHLVLRDPQSGRARTLYSAGRQWEGSEPAKITGTLNRYLHWREFEAYRGEGFGLFDFGGIGDGSSSVAKFKLSFGGFPLEENDFVVAGPITAVGYRAFLSLSQGRRILRRRHVSSRYRAPSGPSSEPARRALSPAGRER